MLLKRGRTTARWTFLTAAVSTFALGAPALAQDQGGAPVSSEDDDGGNAIIVTAQLRAQNIQDVPLAITAVTGEMLEARSQTNVTDISAQVPNLLLQKSPTARGGAIRAYIRGVGQWNPAPAVEPGVGIYIDEVYFGTITAAAFDLIDLDRVEVLRGPQGTLAGMNSLGGAVKLYSRKPGGDGGFVEATIGSMGRRDFRASADFTVIPDAVFARVSGITRNRDGYVKRLDYACVNPGDPDVVSGAIPRMATGNNCQVGDLGDQRMYGLRGSLRIAPVASPFEINLIGDYVDDNSGTRGSVLIASAEQSGRHNTSLAWQGVAFDDRFVPYGEFRRGNSVINDPYVSFANFYDPGYTYEPASYEGPGGPAGDPNGPFIAPDATKNEAWGLSGTVDYEISDNIALKSITGYRTYDSMEGWDNDNSPVVFLQGQYNYRHEQFSQEIRLSGRFADDAVNVTVGGIYYDATTNDEHLNWTLFAGYGPPDKPTFAFRGDVMAELTSYGAFANVGWSLTDALSLEGGLRVTRMSKAFTYGQYNVNGGDYLPASSPDNPINGVVGEYDDTVVDYRGVASYKISNDVMAYAQFATGFKGGGVTPRPYTPHQIRPFGPEKLKSYEVGFKADLLDRRVRLNAAAFHMDYIGYQGRASVCIDADGDPLPPDQGGVRGLCGQFLNLADAKVRGFELEAFLEPVDDLKIDAAVSLTDFEFGAPNYETGDVVAGSRQPEIGDWKWSIGAQYELRIGDIGTLTPRVDVNYTSGFCGNFNCDPISNVDAYTLVNARVTFETIDGDWAVSFEATNLADKLYYINKFSNAWYTTAQPGRPAEYALTVRRNF